VARVEVGEPCDLSEDDVVVGHARLPLCDTLPRRPLLVCLSVVREQVAETRGLDPVPEPRVGVAVGAVPRRVEVRDELLIG
jgi:hypothetical protein